MHSTTSRRDALRRPGAGACKVLIAEDNADSAAFMCKLLELMGHEVCVVGDGLDAVDAAAEFRPDVVIVDIGLPGIDGCEVARRLRRQPGGEKRTLAALTGYAGGQAEARSLEAGFDYHLVKPVEMSALKGLLQTHCPSAA